MRLGTRQRLRQQHGQSMVEFVLLFPVVLVMALAIAELGFMLHANVTVKTAAREGARYASVAALPSAAPGTCDGGSIEERTVDAGSSELGCSEVSVGYIDQAGDPTEFGRGDEVVVRVNHTYATKTPLADLLSALSFGAIPSTVQIRACSDARLELAPVDQTPLAAATGDCGS